jgi:5-methylthioadenosine/S-adenosylhomocysteine deaminase
MLDVLFQNADVITMREDFPVLFDAYVGVRNGRIVCVGNAPLQEPAKRVIDAGGHILMPGLVNTHAHLGMTLLRGAADDFPLHDWLRIIAPMENVIDDDAAYVSAKIGIAEMLSCGITSVSDMDMHLPAVMQAAKEAGINASVCNSAICRPDDHGHTIRKDRAFSEMMQALPLHGADDGRVRMDMGVHAEYTATPELCREIAVYAMENGLCIQLHMSETQREHRDCMKRHGKTPAAFFAEQGVFDVPATAAHCVETTPQDWEIFIKKDVCVAHNPVSNLKLGSGVAPVTDMIAAGVCVSLGTDSACSNNSLDLFEELKLSALLQKGVRRDACAVGAFEALRMATVNGARAQRRETGSIQSGCYADIILLHKNDVSMFPVYDPLSAAVYVATGRNVALAMVRGKVLYENGTFYTLDISALQEGAARIADRIRSVKEGK